MLNGDVKWPKQLKLPVYKRLRKEVFCKLLIVKWL